MRRLGFFLLRWGDRIPAGCPPAPYPTGTISSLLIGKSIQTTSAVTLEGLTVVVNGTPVGIINATSVTGGNALVVTLNANANNAAVQAVLAALAFDNTSDAPSTAPRSLRLTAADHYGDSGMADLPFSVVTVNHDPVATDVSISTNRNAPIGGQPAETDADGDALSFRLGTEGTSMSIRSLTVLLFAALSFPAEAVARDDDKEAREERERVVEAESVRVAQLKRACDAFRQRLAVLAGSLEREDDEAKRKFARLIRDASKRHDERKIEEQANSVIRTLRSRNASEKLDLMSSAEHDCVALRDDLKALAKSLEKGPTRIDSRSLRRDLELRG